MTTKNPTKSLLPAIKAFISNAWIIKQKKLAVTGALAFCASASNSYGEFVINVTDFEKTKRTAQAARFLSQATMGSDLAQIDKLAAQINAWGYYEACEAWIDSEFAKAREDSLFDHNYDMWDSDGRASGQGAMRYLRYGFWDKAVNSNERLRERMAWSLNQIYPVSTDLFSEFRGQRWNIVSHHHDILSDAAFGSFRDLLEDVTYSPVMGIWLSSAQNDKGDPENGLFPDDNYAREVMQLFSTGVYDRWDGGTIRTSGGVPIENYDRDDIVEMAQIFTGLSTRLANGNFSGFFSTPYDNTNYYHVPMAMRDAYHDTSSKILPNGQVLPAGQSGDQDISDALDYLANHRSTRPNISIELIKRLTSSNPSNLYIKRVVQSWKDSNGDLKEIIKAILLDPEARDAVNYYMQGRNRTKKLFRAVPVDELSGRVKEPIIKMAQYYKFYDATTESSDGNFRPVPENHGFGLSGQVFLGAKSVFGFYDTFHAPGNGPIGEYRIDNNVDIIAPELEILARDVIPSFEVTYAIGTDPVKWLNKSQFNDGYTELKLLDQYSAYTTNITTFVNRLDLYLCNGKMPYAINQKLISELSSTSLTRAEKYGILAALVNNSADFMVTY